MSNELPLDASEIKKHIQSNATEYVLNGLVKGTTGFLISPPDSGKSHLSLTIAYELATAVPLLGVSAQSKSQRTLLWPSEDAISATLQRVEEHLKGFSTKLKNDIAKNVSLYTHSDPICEVYAHDRSQSIRAVSSLIETAKNYDLLIIDTLRTAVGNADEVRDDAIIRQTLDQIAQEADVAILVVHHPTKNVSRGNDEINSVSGSGLSSTLSKSKLHLYLHKEIKKSGLIETTLRHTKANYLSVNKQFLPPQKMTWTEHSLLCLHPEALNMNGTAAKRKSVSRKLREIPTEKVILDVEEDDAPAPGGLAQEVFKRRNA